LEDAAQPQLQTLERPGLHLLVADPDGNRWAVQQAF
jgi:hypothetical protein